MDKYVCTVCGYVYDPKQGDPDSGIEPGTKFDDLPEDWECPVCGVYKRVFTKKSSKRHGLTLSYFSKIGHCFILQGPLHDGFFTFR